MNLIVNIKLLKNMKKYNWQIIKDKYLLIKNNPYLRFHKFNTDIMNYVNKFVMNS